MDPRDIAQGMEGPKESPVIRTLRREMERIRIHLNEYLDAIVDIEANMTHMARINKELRELKDAISEARMLM